VLPSDAEQILSRLETELVAHTSGAISAADVRCALAQALRDLDGSVSRDTLPEMAARLVTARRSAAEAKIPDAV
jgi:hypothetical protein